MFSSLKNILQKNSNKPTQPAGEQPTQTRVAAAILLLEASHADDECSNQEIAHIHSTIKKLYNLSNECTSELLEIAGNKRETEVDIWQFTNIINEQYSHQEKISIMETVWQIIYVDGKLDSHEDYYAHKLANLLRLNHSELIDAKMKAKEQAALR